MYRKQRGKGGFVVVSLGKNQALPRTAQGRRLKTTGTVESPVYVSFSQDASEVCFSDEGDKQKRPCVEIAGRVEDARLVKINTEPSTTAFHIAQVQLRRITPPKWECASEVATKEQQPEL